MTCCGISALLVRVPVTVSPQEIRTPFASHIWDGNYFRRWVARIEISLNGLSKHSMG